MRCFLPMIICSIFTSFYASICVAQQVTITYIKMKPSTTADSTIVYPVFHFKDSTVGERVNSAVKKDLLQGYEIPDSITGLPALLKLAAGQGLIRVNYTIARNDRRLLSVVVAYAAVGAFASSWKKYYCFSKKSGSLLTLDSLINPARKDRFLQMLHNKQQAKLQKYRQQLKLKLSKKQIDPSTYEYVLTQLENNCLGNYDPKAFTFSVNKLAVMIDCQFPHAIQSLNPVAEIPFSIYTLQPYLAFPYR